MKRILILNYEFPPLGGGAANATYYLLKEFSKFPDLEVDLVTSSVDKFRIEQFAPNIRIHYLDISKKGNLHYQSIKDLLTYSYKALKYCQTLKKKEKFDLVHAFFGIPCGYIAMKLKIPYIVSLRGSDVPFYNKRFYWLDKFIFKSLSKKIWKKAVSVIANSAALRELALKSAPEQKIDIIYNGVDTEEFKPKNNFAAASDLKIISTGRLIKRKGYEYLIEAISGVKNISLTLVGDGNLKEELQALAKNSKANVLFAGKKNHEEVAGMLRDADIFVMPSLNEGMSNSILEAMACGLPIIATDTGGSEELIKENGFIVAKADSAALKDRIEKLINDRDLILSMGRISRELAEGMSWGKVAEEYFNVYKKYV